ncbi:MAG TPA: 16S rRNA (cytosine(1402)-N(4))-methyltransferase RsmH [Polyangia bacterium]|jgi:16S rRNA (cytosine1402-N4)-methyltransferase
MTTEGAPEPANHEPVLLAEILEFLFPFGRRPGGIFCDVTVGMGGHSEGMLEWSSPTGRLVGLDRDPDALSFSRRRLAPFGERANLMHAPFSATRATLAALGIPRVDGILADLGVSSPQLDRAERGFSFQRSGPLDMRMDQTQGETAAELIARIEERDLVSILRDFGEERFAGRIARRIVETRTQGALDSTAALAAVVAQAMPGRERHKNPATRTFQALRIAVNRELDELTTFLAEAPALLSAGGRLCVMAFHSLEDRMVKRRFRALGEPRPEIPGDEPKYRVVTKRIVIASEAEQERNPRSRSAKLRVLERLA